MAPPSLDLDPAPNGTSHSEAYHGLNGNASYINGHTHASNGHGNPNENVFNDLNLRIVGLGIQYPPYTVGPEALEIIARRFHPSSPALEKVLSINQFTGITARSAIGEVDHPIANSSQPPTIDTLNTVFRTEGIPLAISAARKAIAEWQGSPSDITHIVSTTCTNSANPGFDLTVARELGLRQGVERVLLAGVGCSGGLAALRTAAELALGARYRNKPARILVVACEISTFLIRSELDSISKNEEVRIGACLFSDCASALVLSNGLGRKEDHWLYELLGWEHDVLPETEGDLGFDVHPHGWKVVLTPAVPTLASAAVPSVFDKLISQLPTKYRRANHLEKAADFDWALHPGGSTVITGVEKAMGLTPEHLRASYDVYINHGNSSSATIGSVMNRLRGGDDLMGEGREHVVCCAFGPGIAVELMIVRRNIVQLERPLGNGTAEIEPEPID